MKILSASQIREADRLTIEKEPISSIDLMERAAKSVVDRLEILLSLKTPLVIFCGKGNNGGDGLAIGRMMKSKGYDVRIIVVEHSPKSSPDFNANLARSSDLEYWKEGDVIPATSQEAVLIDAILGTGLQRPLTGLLAEVAACINGLPNLIVAIDMPTGVFADSNENNDLSLALRADVTLTFQAPKKALLHPQTAPACGIIEVLDIGLNQSFIDSISTSDFWVDEEFAAQLYKPRNPFGYKNTFGHSLLAVGSTGHFGAGIMAAQSCLRSGTGLLTCQVPNKAEMLFQKAVPQAMVQLDPGRDHLSETFSLSPYSAIGVGPGIGLHPDTERFVQNLIRNALNPLILDADALNILAENKTWFSYFAQVPILTPHPGEFARLSDVKSDQDQVAAAIQFAKKYNCILVLKGAPTVTVLPNGSCYFNSSGNVGLATGGSGDVLLGLITSLRAQGYGSAESAVLGVYIHGRAVEFALDLESEESVLATDLPKFFGNVFKELSFSNEID